MRKSTLPSVCIVLCLLAIMLVVPFGFAQTTSAIGWSHTYGGKEDDATTSVVQTSDGGYLVVGSTHSFGFGGNDAWLFKIDSEGNQLWSQTYGTPYEDFAASIVQTSDGDFAVAGWTEPSNVQDADQRNDVFWLIRIDSAGKTLWGQTYHPGDYCYSPSLIQTSDGGFALAGSVEYRVNGSLVFGGWLAKVDASGNMQWNQTYAQQAGNLVQASDGGFVLVVSGNLVKVDSAGEILWNQTYGQPGIGPMTKTTDGGYAMEVGDYVINIAGTNRNTEYSLVKVDVSGNVQWKQSYVGPGNQMIQASDGGYALFGDATSPNDDKDFALLKTDFLGNELWSYMYGGLESEYPQSFIQTSEGGYLMVGSTDSFGAGLLDAYLVKTGPSGVMPPPAQGAANSWTELSPMPTSRRSFGAAAVAGKIYAIGGIIDGSGTGGKVNEEYDPVTNAWTTRTPMPTGRYYFGITAYQNKIYVIGGAVNYSIALATNEVYDPAQDAWAPLTPIPTPMNEVNANEVNGKIYVIGGNLNQVYDIATDSWTTETPPPVAVFGYASAVVDDKIYVFSSNATQIYSTDTDTWTSGTPIPSDFHIADNNVATAATTGVVAPEKIYIPNVPTQVYDPETDSWGTGASMLTPRSYYALAASNDLLYAIGGSASVDMLVQTNERYTPMGYPGPTPQPLITLTNNELPSPNFPVPSTNTTTALIVIAAIAVAVAAIIVAMLVLKKGRGQKN
jgi:hypothetical protein